MIINILVSRAIRGLTITLSDSAISNADEQMQALSASISVSPYQL